jgi:hypothetical protein
MQKLYLFSEPSSKPKYFAYDTQRREKTLKSTALDRVDQNIFWPFNLLLQSQRQDITQI